MVTDEFNVYLQVGDKHQKKLTKATAGLREGLLKVGTKQLVQHQQTLAAWRTQSGIGWVGRGWGTYEYHYGSMNNVKRREAMRMLVKVEWGWRYNIR